MAGIYGCKTKCKVRLANATSCYTFWIMTWNLPVEKKEKKAFVSPTFI